MEVNVLNFRRNIFFVLACFGLALNGLPIAFSQQKEPSKPSDSGENKPKLRCLASGANKNQKRTYLVGAAKLSPEDQKRIESNFGKLEIPKNETKRAKKIRAEATRKRAELKAIIENGYQIWLKKNPN